jgi:hypothetical protein
MTTVEKNKMLLELFSLYERSPYGEVLLEDIRSNNVDEINQKLMFLYNEGFVIFGHKPITGKNGEIIEVRINSGIRFTEKGFDYLKELRKSKFAKFWEFLYKVFAPIAIILDILARIFSWLLKK